MDAAVSKMTAIESRLAKLEATTAGTSASSSAATNEALAEYQAQMLVRLRGIRAAMTAEGGDIVQVTAERDQLAAENKKLRKDMEKLNYRVQHLIKALNRAESQ